MLLSRKVTVGNKYFYLAPLKNAKVKKLNCYLRKYLRSLSRYAKGGTCKTLIQICCVQGHKLKKNRTSTLPLSRAYTNRYIMSLIYFLLRAKSALLTSYFLARET